MGIITFPSFAYEVYVNKSVATSIELITLIALFPVLTMVVHDFTRGLPMRIGLYFHTTIACLFPLIVLGTLNVTLTVMGLILLILPGLYLSAVWSVMVPVVVIERAVFQSLTLSSNLTQNYRWPIIGVMSVTTLIFLLISIFLISIRLYFSVRFLGNLHLMELRPLYFFILSHVFQMVEELSTTGFFAVVVVNLNERLRELKEGTGLEGVSDVFE